MDSQRIEGEAIAALLSEVAGLDVLNICCNTTEACACILTQPPQLMILDVELGDDDFRKATDLLLAHNPDAKLLFHTAQINQFSPPEELTKSTIGILYKNDGLDELLELLQRWWQGREDHLRESLPGCERQLHAIQSLSPREHQLLLEIGNGKLNKHIAKSLGITRITVESYRKNVAAKLGISGPELVRLAVIYRGLRWCHHMGQPKPPIAGL